MAPDFYWSFELHRPSLKSLATSRFVSDESDRGMWLLPGRYHRTPVRIRVTPPFVIPMFKTKIKTKDGRKIVVREPKTSDVKEFLRHINKQVRDRTEGINVDKPLTLKQEREWLKGILKEVRAKKKVFLAFEHNKRIIGSCEVRRKNGRGAHVASFGIGMEKEYRRQGIATKAVPILFSLAKKRMKGLKIVELDVFSYNKPAQKAYKKIGFKRVATLPHAVKKKGKLYPKYVMYYYLRR